MNREALKAMADEPAAFQAALVIPSAHGPMPFREVMADFQRERFASINPALVAVAKGRKPATGRFWWEATKGASKDSDLAVCLLWLLAFTTRPLTVQIGAADQEQAAELKKAAKDILRLNRWLASRVRIQSYRILCEATESAADIITSDSASSHGSRPDVVVVNELAHISDFEFAETMLDNASKVPHGLVVVATNAGNVNSPAYKWREMARESTRWSFHQYAQPSPWLDHGEIREAELRNSRARFNRLFRGIWSAGESEAISGEDIEAAITLPGPFSNPAAESGWSFVGGLDLGIKRDRSGFVVLGTRAGEGRVRLAYCQSWRPPRGGEVQLASVEHAIIQAHSRFHLRKVLFDPAQSAYLAQRLRRHGVVMVEQKFVPTNLDSMATTLMEVFRSRMIDLYRHEQLLRDLTRLQIEEKQYGQRLTAVADQDGHADLGIALSIVLPAAWRLAHLAAGGESLPIGSHVAPDSTRHGLYLVRPQFRSNDYGGRRVHRG